VNRLPDVHWDAAGLAPVVVADATTGAVLTLAYANRDALEKTIATGSTWLWSRSRNELWNKGAASCFTTTIPLEGADDAPEGAGFATAVSALARTIQSRKANPVEGSYTAKLFAGGVDRIGKKIGEEATEVVIAAKNADRGELVWETADLLYHALVLLAERGVSLDDVGAELSRRAKPTD
jgi:phosphoribosyl-ATP pyrophosphohydrolase/phosphoribosyl-AMP cyclohydrolase